MLSYLDTLHKLLHANTILQGNSWKQLHAYYRVGLTWSSNAIEGSSYTMSETKVLLEDGITAGGKPLRDLFAALGHARAFDHMVSLIASDGITENDVLLMYSYMDGGLENNAVAGTYRKENVYVSGADYVFPKPDNVPALMSVLFQKEYDAWRDLHPVRQAAFLHDRLVCIHPFMDGNGRIARLAMNTVLLQNGFLPVQIFPVLRQEYIDSIRASQNQEGKRAFVDFVARSEIESMKEILRMSHVPVPQINPENTFEDTCGQDIKTPETPKHTQSKGYSR